MIITAVVAVVVLLALGAAGFFLMRTPGGAWSQIPQLAPATIIPPPSAPAPPAPEPQPLATDSATGLQYQPDEYAETVDPDPAADAAAMAVDAADAATDSVGVGGDMGLDVQQEAEDVYLAEQAQAARRSAERRAAQVRADERAEAAAAERRLAQLAAESAAMEAREIQQAQAAAYEQKNLPDALYEQRRGGCAGGFIGSACRKQLRYELCGGRWSDSPPAGESICATKNR